MRWLTAGLAGDVARVCADDPGAPSLAVGVEMCVCAVCNDSVLGGAAGSRSAGVGSGSGGEYAGGGASSTAGGLRSGKPDATPEARLEAKRMVDETAVSGGNGNVAIGLCASVVTATPEYDRA